LPKSAGNGRHVGIRLEGAVEIPCCRNSTSPTRVDGRRRRIRFPPCAQPSLSGRLIAPTLTAVVDNVQQMTLRAFASSTLGDNCGVHGADRRRPQLAGQEEVAYALRGAPKASLRQRVRHHPDYGWDSLSRNTDLRVFVAIPILAKAMCWVRWSPHARRETSSRRFTTSVSLSSRPPLVLIVAVFALAWFTA